MTLSRHRPSRVFVRYALSYLLLLIVVFVSVTVYVTGYVNDQLKSALITSHVNRLSRIAAQHAEYITGMMHTAEQIGSNPYMLPFVYAQEPGRAWELQQLLIPYTATNSFCDQLYLHFAGDDHMYSSSASMTVDMFTSLMRYEHTDAASLASLIETADRLTVLSAQHVSSSLTDSGQVVTFLLPLGASPKSSRGTLLFLIREDAYREMFQDAIDSELNTLIFFGDELLAGTEDLSVDASLVLSALNAGQDQVQGGDGPCMLIATDTLSWNMRYVTVIPRSALDSTVRGAELRVVLILLALAAVSTCLALFLAMRHTKPIRAISSMLPGNDSEGEEPRDELRAISSGIRALAHSNTELASRLTMAIPMQRHEFALKFIKGRFTAREEAIRAAAQFGADVDRTYYAVILVGLSETDRPDEIPQMKDATVLFSELVAVQADLCLIFSDRKEAPRELAQWISAKLLEAGGHYTVALSGVQTDFTRAPSAYLEAATAYDNRFISGDGVLAYEEISHNMEDVLPKAQKLVSGISQALVLGNAELLETRMEELVSFLKTTTMSPFAFRMIYNDVIDTLLRQHAFELSMGQDARDMYSIFSLTSCQSIDDLQELLRGLCQDILRAGGKEKTAPTEEDVISQVVAYMDENYPDPEISMAAIAESFDLSTTRLSTAFKERMHMSPLEYLSVLRAEAARKLLKETDLPVRDIGVRVGYYDPGSFTRRFKQITGLTPLQYRKGQTEERAEERVTSSPEAPEPSRPHRTAP